MADRRKYIDRALRTKLKDYHEAAPAEVWDGVADHLAMTRRKGRVLWITRISAAAVVVVMAGSAWFLMRNNEDRTLSQDERITQEYVSDQEQTVENEDALQTEAGDQPGDREAGEPQSEAERADGSQAGEQLADRSQAGEQLAESITEERNVRVEETNIRVEETMIAGTEQSTEDSYSQAQALLTGQETDAESPMAGNDFASVEAMYIAALDPGTSHERAPDILRENKTYPRILPEEKDQSEGIVLIDETTDSKAASGSRWALGTQVSPVYSYRDLGGGSSVFSRLAPQAEDASSYSSNSVYNSVESGMMAYSGGVNLNYLPGDRLSVQSGIYYSKMGLSIDHAYLTPNFEGYSGLTESLKYNTISNSQGTITTASPTSPTSSGTIITNWSPDRGTADFANQAVTDQQGGQVNRGQVEQQFEYLEVPMILKYKMVDRRIGFNLLGGMTTNFLIGSDVYDLENNNRDRIGETTDIRKVNYSSLVGFGMDYKLSEKFQLNFEPFFKYYLNSINLSSAIKSHPYSIGVYTGISYLF